MTHTPPNPSLDVGTMPADTPCAGAAPRKTNATSCSYTFVGTAGWRTPQLIAVIRTASLFPAEVRIRKDARTADGKSFLGLLKLGVRFGDKLTIHATGHAASEALLAVAALPFFAPIA